MVLVVAQHYQCYNNNIIITIMTFLLSPASFDQISFVRMLAAIYTIDSINEANFLPGVRLGYAVYDPCADATKALHSVEQMLSTNGSLPVMDDYSEFRPKVKVILGARYSLLTIPVAKLLSVYLFPQVRKRLI